MPGISTLLRPNSPYFTILAVTDGVVTATGIPREELVGRDLFEVFPGNPEDTTGEQEARASLDYVLTHKKPHQLPLLRYDIPNDEGTYDERYWKVHRKPVLDSQGEVLYIIHTSDDVTEQIKAEQREAKIKDIERVYNFFMQAPVIIAIVKGPEYTIELANKDMLFLWGRGPEVIGKPLLEAIPELEHQGFIPLLDRVRETGEPFYAYESPSTLIRDGKEEVRYLDFVYQPYYDNPSDTVATGVIGMAHDVTEQVLARQRVEEVNERLDFRNALFEAENEVTPDGVLIVDPKGNMVLHNRRFAEIWDIPQEVTDTKDRKAALRHALTMVADPQTFLSNTEQVYAGNHEKAYDEVLLKDGRVIERRGTRIIAESGVNYGWAWYYRDITDRIRQEQKFRNVVEQASDPILILKGEDLVLEVANQALLELWQVGSDAINKPFLEILPEMKDQVFVGLLLNVLRTGEPFYGNETPAVFKRRNGNLETRYVNFSYNPYREADGTITGVLVMANDVTGQVMAKQQLVESERNFRNMILQSPVAMCILKGSSFTVEIANDRMFELWGRGADELLHKPIFEGIPEAREQGLEDLLIHVYTTGETFRASERPVNLPRGGKVETLYINFVYEPFHEGDGSISGIMAVAIDVTDQVLARHETEVKNKELQFVLDFIPQLVWHTLPDGRSDFFNQTYLDYAGLPTEQLLGNGWLDILHPDDRETTTRVWQTALTGSGSYAVEHRLRSRDGSYHWFLTRGVPLKDEQGQIIKWYGTSTDIQEQKTVAELLESRVEERTRELLEANNSLRRINAELEQFTYVSHHDLQEPIRKIQIFTEMVRSDSYDKLTAASQKRLDRVTAAAERMSAALKDVLNYASLNKEEQPEQVDLNEVLETVQTDLEVVISEKQASISVAVLPTIRAVPRQMHQLFYNLLNNALKFSKPDAQPMITITSQKAHPSQVWEQPDLDNSKDYYEIAVSDNGIGFDQDYENKIFLMFQRLHSKDAYAGTGIGLALAKKVALRHGGKIWAESREGEGAVFKVLLPANE
ncbi:PAS domain-containing protein [Telluribacter sp. SYSU D00476]|uniref:PAS domain-containing protein n=1 Tax=Telluribacter sp. SYSU D00476 TaxID=2811430 RepID=UPI001FF5CD5F|nr:PAS domain-containing protein [Telluribacter sp. SYSU D00476]